MTDCLFCKIINGTESSVSVYEDELCLAFMDIYPLSPGHVLLIPKHHSELILDQTQTVRAHLSHVAHEIVRAQRQAGFGKKGSHFLINDGKGSNQHIPHVHLHLIPRHPNDSLRFAYKLFMHFTGLFGFKTKLEELQAAAEKIRAQLPSQIIGNEYLAER